MRLGIGQEASGLAGLVLSDVGDLEPGARAADTGLLTGLREYTSGGSASPRA
ncbi:hypothetical protein ACFU8Q_19970 [Streptomyces sp. NPDC057543]|uniref:hypothetical protein n=1 Tax=Streptomyces sp. NPDC057543 TaxID=3346163 RepID=UPI00369E2DFE